MCLQLSLYLSHHTWKEIWTHCILSVSIILCLGIPFPIQNLGIGVSKDWKNTWSHFDTLNSLSLSLSHLSQLVKWDQYSFASAMGPAAEELLRSGMESYANQSKRVEELFGKIWPPPNVWINPSSLINQFSEILPLLLIRWEKSDTCSSLCSCKIGSVSYKKTACPLCKFPLFSFFLHNETRRLESQGVFWL